MHIKKQKRVMQKNSEKCLAYEYPFHDKDIDLCYVEIDGRYPDSGYVMNQKVKEMVFVEKGRGKLVFTDKEHILEEGDAVLLLPNEKYFFEGNLKLIISSSPAWYPEQHKKIDK